MNNNIVGLTYILKMGGWGARKSKNGLPFQTNLRATVEENSYCSSRVLFQCTELGC